MLIRLHKFLNGEFTCMRCGKIWNSHGLGFGKMVCPECYTHEDLYTWFRPNMNYWLNRLMYGNMRLCEALKNEYI